MSDVPEALLSFPGLVQALAEGEVELDADPESLEAAEGMLAQGTQVKFLPVPPRSSLGPADFGWDNRVELCAVVILRSARTYTVALDFLYDGEWFLDGSCDCREGFGCEHISAAMIDLSRRVTRRPARQAQSSIVSKVDWWLVMLKLAADPTGAVTEAAARSGQTHFLAYCVEFSDSFPGAASLSLHPARARKDGRIRIERTQAILDARTQPPYMSPDDDLPCALFARLERTTDSPGHAALEGKLAAQLLRTAMEMGRLYHTEACFELGSWRRRAPIGKGPHLHVKPAWKRGSGGGLEPVLNGLPAGARLILSDPPFYFDPLEAVLGSFESSVPLRLLFAWVRGPEIDPALADKVIEEIGRMNDLALPAPEAIPTETLPATGLIPRFRVRSMDSVSVGKRYGTIFGELSLRYGEGPAFLHDFTTIPPSVLEFANGKRIVHLRDEQAEQEAVDRLRRAGFVPCRELTTSYFLAPALRTAWTVVDPLPTREMAWLELLHGPALLALREEGWEIEIDPDCGLTICTAGDFLPVISPDPDHGIDWFRFDVSCEIGGERHSLIPYIAYAIQHDFPTVETPDLPEFFTLPREDLSAGCIRLPARPFLELVDRVRHLFLNQGPSVSTFQLDRLAAAGLAASLDIRSDETTRALADLACKLQDIQGIPKEKVPPAIKADLRPYQAEGFRWLRFLASHQLNGILADDMGLGKTIQTLAYLAAEHGIGARKKSTDKPSLVVAPTSVVPNWAAEAQKFVPRLKVVVLHGADRAEAYDSIPHHHLVLTSYALLHRDVEILARQEWHSLILDEAQAIKNPKSATACAARLLQARHRLCLSGTPMENHLGELWSLMQFLMPGFLGSEKDFNTVLRKPIERDCSREAQLALNRRVAPLILRRNKNQVASELPEKTEIVHHIDLHEAQVRLYESVRAVMDERVREAIRAKGLAQSQIIVLDALLKLRQICCHPLLLRGQSKKPPVRSAKLDFLSEDLLPSLLDAGRRILLFSQFTSMLDLIRAELNKAAIPHLMLTGRTRKRGELVEQFQTGKAPVFLISLKAGGTGLNLTAADTVIHYDPWWNPAAENQATDRAHRIGQTKPVFIHKLVCRGSIEDRILELQQRKSALVKALLSEETTKRRIDQETLSQLLAPMAGTRKPESDRASRA